jgi:hypothetical protein
MKTSYFLAASLMAVMCALPASARDHQSEHKDTHRVSDRDHNRDRREDIHRDRERHLQHERADSRRDQREAQLRQQREQRWRDGHHGQSGHAFRDGNSANPPGWDHGKKRGWKGDNLPPGQAKKS